MPANLENSAVATGLEKVCFHSNAKERSNYHTIALISHTSKVKLKILQARLQRYMNSELPDVQAGYTKGRGTRDNCQHPLDHRKSNTVPEKNIYFWVIDYAKDLDCVDHILLFVCFKTTMTELSHYNKANDFQNLHFLLSASL